MKNFKIELTAGGRAEGTITSKIKASSQQDADDYAQALADMLPQRTYYCSKNSKNIEVNWYGYANEIK